MDVSVIITSYHIERYIRRAIESALSQTGITLEVIVVDDASSDGTWQIIQSITDARLRALQLTQNNGPSIARNTALDMAQGDWVAVLDGDDAFAPGRLQRMLDLAKVTNADCVVDDLNIHDEASGAHHRMFGPKMTFSGGILTLADFIAGNDSLFGGYTLGYLKPIMSRRFLAQHTIRYWPEVRLGEDYYLMAEMLAHGARCAMLPEPLYIYTIRAGSLSRSLTSKDIRVLCDTDARFTTGHVLTGDAAVAQRRRTRGLNEALAFNRCVEALKQRALPAAIRAIVRQPMAMRHFRQPIVKRLKRWTA